MSPILRPDRRVANCADVTYAQFDKSESGPDDLREVAGCTPALRVRANLARRLQAVTLATYVRADIDGQSRLRDRRPGLWTGDSADAILSPR